MRNLRNNRELARKINENGMYFFFHSEVIGCLVGGWSGVWVCWACAATLLCASCVPRNMGEFIHQASCGGGVKKVHFCSFLVNYDILRAIF